jgi:hypothetical protein
MVAVTEMHCANLWALLWVTNLGIANRCATRADHLSKTTDAIKTLVIEIDIRHAIKLTRTTREQLKRLCDAFSGPHATRVTRANIFIRQSYAAIFRNAPLAINVCLFIRPTPSPFRADSVPAARMPAASISTPQVRHRFLMVYARSHS